MAEGTNTLDYATPIPADPAQPANTSTWMIRLEVAATAVSWLLCWFSSETVGYGQILVAGMNFLVLALSVLLHLFTIPVLLNTRVSRSNKLAIAALIVGNSGGIAGSMLWTNMNAHGC